MKKLKKWLFPGSVLAVLALGTATVLHSKPNPHFVINGGAAAFEYAFQNKAAIQPSGKMVEVLLNSDVKRIQNSGSVNVRQFCSPKAKGSIELDSALLAVLDQDLLKQGIIKTTQNDFGSQMPAITFMSDHEIEHVENSGAATVKIQCPSIFNLKVRNLGAGGVEVLTGFIKSVEVENLGVGYVYAPNVTDIQIDSRGTGNVAVGEATKADVKLYGVGTVSFKNAPAITSSIKGMGVIKTNTPHPYD
jgi:hypothetical protein